MSRSFFVDSLLDPGGRQPRPLFDHHHHHAYGYPPMVPPVAPPQQQPSQQQDFKSLLNLYSNRFDPSIAAGRLLLHSLLVPPSTKPEPIEEKVEEIRKKSENEEKKPSPLRTKKIKKLIQEQPAPVKPTTSATSKSAESSPSSSQRLRTAFTSNQIIHLEHEFSDSMYLSRLRRIEIAHFLGLSEKQVKIWFQNRRVKHKKEQQQQGSTGTPIQKPNPRRSITAPIRCKCECSATTTTSSAATPTTTVTTTTDDDDDDDDDDGDDQQEQ